MRRTITTTVMMATRTWRGRSRTTFGKKRRSMPCRKKGRSVTCMQEEREEYDTQEEEKYDMQ